MGAGSNRTERNARPGNKGGHRRAGTAGRLFDEE